MTAPCHAVLVLGIARSGTSALAGALAAMGVDFGTDMKPVDWRNPKGNFEHFTLSRLNQKALALLGSNWSDSRPLPVGWQKHPGIAAIAAEIGDRIRADFGTSRLFGLKDPRLVPLFPLYRDALARMGATVHIVSIARAEREVLSSIRRSGYFHGWYLPWRGRRLYRHYMRMIAEIRAGQGGIHLAHADLMRDPAAVLADLATLLPFREAGLSADLDAGAAFVDPGLYRQRDIWRPRSGRCRQGS